MMPLVEFEISGSPTISPGGPRVFVDDQYRGNPIDGRFRLFLQEGEHHVRLMNLGDIALWEEEIVVLAVPGSDLLAIPIRYGWDPQAQ